MKHKVFALQDFKALDEQQGVFEAIVAVFGNVDRTGDMVMPGAFKGTLARWQEKQRPIPVIFAHEWENLDAHVGEVLEAKEVDKGLYVKAQLDLEEDYARRVWKRMKKGTLAEFSFSYDVLKSKLVPVEEGEKANVGHRFINELHELELFEVGPCLVGMNPDTELLGVKSDRYDWQEIHDMAVQLGAKCTGHHEGDAERDDKGQAKEGVLSNPSPSTVAARIATELIEAGFGPEGEST